MTSGRLLARNTALNLIGQGAPMVVAVVAIPLLIHGLGTDRFGVLTLAWMAIGYFSLFDLGLSRALTQLLAERLGAESQEEIPALTWTALLLMVLLGVVGGGLLALLSPFLVGGVLNISPELQPEALRAFYLLAASLPCVISTAGLRGVLEAHQRFGAVNAIRLPMGVLTFLGPLLVLPFSRSLVPVVAVLAVGRVLAWIAHLAVCLRALPYLRGGVVLRREVVGPLVRFGGWMTASNIVSPLMVYVDRFLIGALLSMAAVAYYVTPYEVVTKLWLIPGALLGVLFPAFAASAASDRSHTARLFARGVRAIFLAMFPPILLLVTLAPEGLGLWLGSDFALHSAPILRWLAVGVFINSLGQAPFTVLQGIGRPDITGKLHLLELPLYGAAIYWLVQARGVEGAAIAWVLRVSLDTAVLFLVAARALPAGGRILRRLAALIGPALLALGAALLPQQAGGKVAFLLVVLPAFALLAWRYALEADERAVLRGALTSRSPLPHAGEGVANEARASRG